MGITKSLAQDLLDQAAHLATKETRKPKQASLRRAISTAYYSLFHLLTTEGVGYWKVAAHRAKLARAFDHRRMKEVSLHVVNRKFPHADQQAVRRLKFVAETFSDLQLARHSADYDHESRWTRSEALVQIDSARSAIAAWKSIRESAPAQDYLLALLVRDR